MKTRQEMVYDFMIALASNGAVYQDWSDNIEDFGDYSENIKTLAEELALYDSVEVYIASADLAEEEEEEEEGEE